LTESCCGHYINRLATWKLNVSASALLLSISKTSEESYHVFFCLYPEKLPDNGNFWVYDRSFFLCESQVSLRQEE